MVEILNTLNDYLWTYVVITLLVGCALYFTLRTRGVQFRMLKDMARIMLGLDGKEEAQSKPSSQSSRSSQSTQNSPSTQSSPKNPRRIGSFQAFAVSLASRVGTGNLAGVASAIFVGGPGAVFWMWVMALLGSATAFVEATLAQLYKRRGADSFYGGPAYYMESGLHRRWMGVLFAVLITVTFGLANQVVQSNTLIDAVNDSLGIDKLWLTTALTAFTLVIIFGGIHRIARFTSICVPFMALGFIIISVYVVAINITAIPHVFRLIVESAFGLKPAAGGMVGVAIMQGVKRGLYSNEAGEGSAPNAAAIADTTHPVKQGLLQALGVFTDTIVICSCTALIVLLSGLYDQDLDGIILTSHALEASIGPAGRYFVTAAIVLFAYSTIIANYFYGETNIRFITNKMWGVQLFRILSGAVVFIGGLVTLQTAWSMVDFVMGLMTILNLVAIILLSEKVFFLLKDYLRQRREGHDPVFHKSQLPKGKEDVECWE